MNRAESMNRGISGVAPITDVTIPSMKDHVSAEEWAIRVPAEVVAPFMVAR